MGCSAFHSSKNFCAAAERSKGSAALRLGTFEGSHGMVDSDRARPSTSRGRPQTSAPDHDPKKTSTSRAQCDAPHPHTPGPPNPDVEHLAASCLNSFSCLLIKFLVCLLREHGIVIHVIESCILARTSTVMYEEIEDLNEKHRIPTVSMHTRGVCGYVLHPHARALRDCRLHVVVPSLAHLHSK